MSKAKMIKGMVKAKKESVMGKLGDGPFENPWEPWSIRHDAPMKEEVETLEEDSWLFSYIRSLGYNPKIMNFAQRSKYARSNAFKHWKQSHMERRPGETATMEETENLEEAGTGLLMNFIKAKGLNPLSMDGNQKQAYSRSSEFRIFKQKHQKEEFDRLIETYGVENLLQIVLQKQELQETSGMGERGDDWNEENGKDDEPPFDGPYKKTKGDVTDKSGAKHSMQSRVRHLARSAIPQDKKTVKEELDQADTVTMDIPLLIRVLEYAREDAKTDMDLHKVVENLIKMRDEGTLSMAQYDKIIAIKEAIEANYDKKYQDMVKRVGQKAAQKPVDMKALAARMQAAYAKKEVKELKNIPDNMDADPHLTREDLRQWFSKTHPEGDWKRINSKGEVEGPCAREPGEPKPKCMSKEKRSQLSKSERAAAVAAKRKYDPVADRSGKGGKPVNVSNFGKGKLGEASSPAQQAAIAIAMKKAGKTPKNEEVVDEACWDTHKQVGTKMKGGKVVPNCVPKNEEVEQIDEKNKPTNPSLWSKAKSMARSKFDVYPSAYANGWASKWYKSKGGGWKSVKESTVQEGLGNVEDSPMSATNSVKAMESAHRKNQMKSARMIKSLYKKKVKENLYDWEKDDKPNAKIVVKGGTTMTGQPRDTIEIEPVLKTRPNQTKPTV